jgi:hypothetical protein
MTLVCGLIVHLEKKKKKDLCDKNIIKIFYKIVYNAKV